MTNSNGDVAEKDEGYYNERCKRRSLDECREVLRHSSHSHLIEQIEKYESDQQQLLDLIRNYDKNLEYLVEVKSCINVIEKLINKKNTEEFNREKEDLCKTFDEAFNQ